LCIFQLGYPTFSTMATGVGYNYGPDLKSIVSRFPIFQFSPFHPCLYTYRVAQNCQKFCTP